MKVKSESEVAQLCPTLSDSMDCSLPGSSVHGIFQARVLEWLPLPSPKKVMQEKANKRQTAPERGTEAPFSYNVSPPPSIVIAEGLRLSKRNDYRIQFLYCRAGNTG